MLEEIHLAGSMRTSLRSFCGAFADVSRVELGKAPEEWPSREAMPARASGAVLLRNRMPDLTTAS